MTQTGLSMFFSWPNCFVKHKGGHIISGLPKSTNSCQYFLKWNILNLRSAFFLAYKTVLVYNLLCFFKSALLAKGHSITNPKQYKGNISKITLNSWHCFIAPKWVAKKWPWGACTTCDGAIALFHGPFRKGGISWCRGIRLIGTLQGTRIHIIPPLETIDCHQDLWRYK